MLIFVEPKLLASKKTKERIKNHGPNFFPIVQRHDLPVCNGEECIMLQSEIPDSDGTRWLGWFPVEEIKATEVFDKEANPKMLGGPSMFVFPLPRLNPNYF